MMTRIDTVVIGAGLAGLTTAAQLVQAGQKVLLVSGGFGAILLASGCIDVLGFQPVEAKEPVTDPLGKLGAFIKEAPDHPYALVKDNVEAGLEGFKQVVNGSLTYQGDAHHNWLLPSTAGAVHPTCLAPISLANGDLSRGGQMLIVGFRQLRDFYPALISQNLNAQKLGVEADSLVIDLPAPLPGEVNITPIELAHAFEKVEFRRALVRAIKDQAKGVARVGFPAVLGLERHAEVLADLEKQLGKTVFEISTLPPSVPGRRLFESLRTAALKAGGRIIIGSKAASGTIVDGQVTEIQIETSNRLKTIRARNYVLATGGIYGGGIQTDLEGNVWEPIFGLPVEADSNRHHWFSHKFLSEHGQPVAQYGVKVDENLNPINGSRQPLAKNLFIAGATIAGADWTRGRTGDGLALATAATIVKQIS